MTNIQYSYGGNGTTCTVKNCDFFPEVKVSKEQRECLSVKVCEFASEELDIGHTSVDFQYLSLKICLMPMKSFTKNQHFG